MRLFLLDSFWSDRLPYGIVVKLKYLGHSQADHFYHLDMSYFKIIICISQLTLALE